MLDIIYYSLGVIIVALQISFLAFIIVLFNKNKYNSIAGIRGRIVLLSIILALYIFKVILAVILSESLVLEILGVTLWVVLAVQNICYILTRKKQINNHP